MGLPNPLTFQMRVRTIQSNEQTSGGSKSFLYQLVKHPPPGSGETEITMQITVDRPNADQYPIGQILSVAFSTVP